MKKIIFILLIIFAISFESDCKASVICLDGNEIIEAMIMEETHWQFWKTSNMGCVGLMQIGRDTLTDYNIDNKTKWTMKEIRLNPVKNRKVGTWYWRKGIPKIFRNMNRNLRKKKVQWQIQDNLKNRLIAYNACPNRAKKYNNPDHKEYKYLPKETRNHLKKVSKRLGIKLL